MKLLHAMIRVTNIEKSLQFYKDVIGLKEKRRKDFPEGKFSLIFLGDEISEVEIELTDNWDECTSYSDGKNFGHLAFEVENIYESCKKIMDNGIDILRPPRDGKMAFIKSPENISIELLQKGDPLTPEEPWINMQNIGTW